jgi:hypothetical protein
LGDLNRSINGIYEPLLANHNGKIAFFKQSDEAKRNRYLLWDPDRLAWKITAVLVEHRRGFAYAEAPAGSTHPCTQAVKWHRSTEGPCHVFALPLS